MIKNMCVYIVFFMAVLLQYFQMRDKSKPNNNKVLKGTVKYYNDH